MFWLWGGFYGFVLVVVIMDYVVFYGDYLIGMLD